MIRVKKYNTCYDGGHPFQVRVYPNSDGTRNVRVHKKVGEEYDDDSGNLNDETPVRWRWRFDANPVATYDNVTRVFIGRSPKIIGGQIDSFGVASSAYEERQFVGNSILLVLNPVRHVIIAFLDIIEFDLEPGDVVEHYFSEMGNQAPQPLILGKTHVYTAINTDVLPRNFLHDEYGLRTIKDFRQKAHEIMFSNGVCGYLSRVEFPKVRKIYDETGETAAKKYLQKHSKRISNAMKRGGLKQWRNQTI
jgi:hypothetical protein